MAQNQSVPQLHSSTYHKQCSILDSDWAALNDPLHTLGHNVNRAALHTTHAVSDPNRVMGTRKESLAKLWLQFTWSQANSGAVCWAVIPYAHVLHTGTQAFLQSHFCASVREIIPA